MTAQGKEETLLLEGFTGDNSLNITVDDDIIFASQGERQQKIKTFKNLQCLKDNYNLSNIDFLKSADINNQTVEGYKNFSPCDEKASFSIFKKSDDEDAIKNTQSVFVSAFSSSWDHKLPKITQNIVLEENITAETYHVESNIKNESQRESTNFLSMYNIENIIRSENYNALFSSLQKNKTLFFDSNKENEENLTKDISQSFSNEVYKCCKKDSTSCEEVLTSGIILPTQPKEPVQFNTKKNLKHELENSECCLVKKKVSQNQDFVEENKPFNIETNTINFALSITCFVVTDKNTNEIMDKFILNVTELSNPSKEITEKVECEKNSKGKKFAMQDSCDSVPVLNNSCGKSFETVASEGNSTVPLEHLEQGEKPIHRIKWSNEYLLPSKLDELVKNYVENSNKGRWLASAQSNFEKEEIKNLNKNINEVEGNRKLFSFETNISYRKYEGGDEKSFVEKNTKDFFRSQNTEHFFQPFSNTFVEISNVKNFNHKEQLNIMGAGRKEKSRSSKSKLSTRRNSTKRNNRRRKKKVRLSQGQSVLAKQTIEQYCPAVLIRHIRDDCWRVKFNGGIVKTVSVDRILPWKWLRKGDLVLVLIYDKYCPGKIIDINSGKEISYYVELEDDCSKIIVKKTHLSVTDAMAGVLKKRCSLLRRRIPLVNFSTFEKSLEESKTLLA